MIKNILWVMLFVILMASTGWAASFSVRVSITNGTVRVDADDPLGEISGVGYSLDTNGNGSFADETEWGYSVPITINSLNLLAGHYAVRGVATNSVGELIADTNAFDHVRLTMPPVVYAVEGLEAAIYYSNIMNSTTTDVSVFNVVISADGISATGAVDRWAFTPTAGDVGDHAMSVSVWDPQGRLLAEVTNQLHVAPADSVKKESVTLLIVGDSLTAAGVYPLRLATLLNQVGNPPWAMQGKKSAGSNAYHEGYGGNTWLRFIAGYPADPTYSPFFYPQPVPKLDFQRYLDENEAGDKPDIITVNLGINDTFSASTSSLATIDASIDIMFTNATVLLNAFRAVCPATEIGIGITTPANARPSAFLDNYKDADRIWRWKHIQRRLAERIIAEYRDREDEGLFLIPSHLNLDNVNGFPSGNAVHPNATGYNQMGDSFYAWLKWRLEMRAPQGRALPFRETFETTPPDMAGLVGPLNGQHSWRAVPEQNAVVQRDEAWTGSQAALITNAIVNHVFDDNPTNVWVSLTWKTTPDEPPGVIPEDATVVFWADTQGSLSAYSNTSIVRASHIAIDPTAWGRVVLHSDYARQRWSLWFDGKLAFSECAFFSNQRNTLKEIQFAVDSRMLLDDILVTTTTLQPESGIRFIIQ